MYSVVIIVIMTTDQHSRTAEIMTFDDIDVSIEVFELCMQVT